MGINYFAAGWAGAFALFALGERDYGWALFFASLFFLNLALAYVNR